MSIAVAIPVIKTLLMAMAVAAVSAFAVTIICDFAGKPAAVPVAVTIVAVMVCFFPALARQARDLMDMIFY